MAFARQAVGCVCWGRLVGALVSGVLVSGALVSGVGAPGAAEAAAGFLSHRAVYDLSLAKSRSNGSVIGASGNLRVTRRPGFALIEVVLRTAIRRAGAARRALIVPFLYV